RIFEPVYRETFVRSTKLALLSTFLVILIGYPFGYFMARLDGKWRNRAMLLLIIPFWTSSLMRLYGWIIVFRANGVLDSVLLSLGLTGEPLKLLYTYPAVVTGMVYALSPFMIYSVYTSAEKLDWSLVEAARNLGASSLQAFCTVSFPLTMPGLFSGVVLTFIPSMGLYFIADILGGNKVALVGNLIQEQLMKAHDWPFAASLSVVLMVMTSLFLYLYRRLTRSGELEGLV
ncbi:MAG: ABC transporter permease, partial [Treponema sp.]|nr:ABC transporter permease [Treponema sp.]